MSLGETIYRLRGERNMSQGNLADLLDVSRQSVSRWETDSAIPELDKLVKLSGIFGVTLDELVTGVRPEHTPEPPASPPTAAENPLQPQPQRCPHRIAGTILMCMGFLVVLLLTMLGGVPDGFLSGLLLASPFLVCGVVCLAARRHVGLWCGWALYLCVDLYLRYATGISWNTIRLTAIWTYEWNYARLATAWAQFAVMLLLIVLTLAAFRKLQVRLAGRGKILFTVGWVLYAATYIPLPISVSFLNHYRFLSALVLAVHDWAQMGLFTALLAISLAAWRGRRTNCRTGSGAGAQ